MPASRAPGSHGAAITGACPVARPRTRRRPAVWDIRLGCLVDDHGGPAQRGDFLRLTLAPRSVARPRKVERAAKAECQATTACVPSRSSTASPIVVVRSPGSHLWTRRRPFRDHHVAEADRTSARTHATGADLPICWRATAGLSDSLAARGSYYGHSGGSRVRSRTRLAH